MSWYTLADYGLTPAWYTLAGNAWYTLADYEWYTLADGAWYIIVRSLTTHGNELLSRGAGLVPQPGTLR